MVLIALSCAWLVGILVGWYFDVSWYYGLLGLLPLALFFFTRFRRKAVLLLGLVLIVLPLAAVYSYSQLNEYDTGDLRFYNDRGTMQLRGVVSDAPDVRDNSTRLTVSVSEIETAGVSHEVTGKLLVFVPRYPAFDYGDYINVSGSPETPTQFDDFDYRGYLAGQGIHTVMFYPQVEVLATGRGSPALSGIYSLRNSLSDSLGQVLPEPQASLAQGVILGIRGDIPADVTESFSRSGLSHLLAISGLHLGIIAGVMLGLGLWLFGRRHYLYVWLALAAVWFFAVITGFHLPVVRGAIMASLFLFAEALGRQRSAIVALVFAAAVMVGVWPYILGNASFQLSFLAMSGLVFIFPIVRDFGRRITSRFLGEEGFVAATANASVDILAATLGAVLAVWPVVAYYFGIVSLVGPLATFLALPALPGAIVFGSLAAVLGLFVMPVAQVVGWLAWLFLSYILAVAHGLAAPSGAVVPLDSVSPVFIWIYYPVLGFLLWVYHQGRSSSDERPDAPKRPIRVSFPLSRRMKWILAVLLLAAVLVTGMAFTLPDPRLHVTFLDVGEGDATLIQVGSRQVLIDGGPSPQALGVALGRKMPFWDRRIDLVILTHPHQDHLAGLVDVLRDFQVEKVMFVASPYPSPLYDEWLDLIDEKAIKTVDACPGCRVDLGEGIVLEVLGPPDTLFKGTESDTDNNSVVTRLSDGEVSFLLCGDIMRDAETALAFSRAVPPCTVLKVAHHGSDTSTVPEFLAVVDPQVAVISAGADNTFGHPDGSVVSRLQRQVGMENLYRTDLDGTIEFTTDGSRLWVDVER